MFSSSSKPCQVHGFWFLTFESLTQNNENEKDCQAQLRFSSNHRQNYSTDLLATTFLHLREVVELENSLIWVFTFHNLFWTAI
jgi:hypothetical protein